MSPPATTRILASTGPLFARPLEWACAVIADAGYDGIELMVTQDPATQDPRRVAAAIAPAGIPVPAVHGPFLLLTRRVFGTDPADKARRSLDLAGDLGAEVMIVHPPYRWQRRFHTWLLDEGERAAADVGSRIGVENLYPVTVAGRPMRFHRYTLPEHLEPFPHVVLDTSHFGVAGVDINRAYELLSPRTVHLHVSDNRGLGRDSHAPLGHGVLPLARFLHRVGRDAAATSAGDSVTAADLGSGAATSITLELDCRRYLDDRAALVGYLRQERQKCLALLAGASAEEVLGRPDVVASPPGGVEDDPDQPTVG